MRNNNLIENVEIFLKKLKSHLLLHKRSLDHISFDYNENYKELEQQSEELLTLLGSIKNELLKYNPHWIMESNGTRWDALSTSVGMGSLVCKDMSLQLVVDRVTEFLGFLKNGSIEISLSEEDNLIEFMKNTMINVSTGLANIKDVNEAYKNAYKELASIFTSKKISNPNPFSDLWEFYKYWKENLPSYAERRDYVIKIYKQQQIEKTKESVPFLDFVHESRINELSKLKSPFDLSKLCKLLAELNSNYRSKNFYSCGILLRTIIDHIPPLFNKLSFKEVANTGTKSFRETMDKLDGSLRKISDSYLHTHIRNKEILPEEQQIRFHAELDLLLAEIIRTFSSDENK